jgi:hypothetical protein
LQRRFTRLYKEICSINVKGSKVDSFYYPLSLPSLF